MGTQRRNYKHGDQKPLHRSIMAVTSGPIYLKHKIILFYQYIIYKHLKNELNNLLYLLQNFSKILYEVNYKSLQCYVDRSIKHCNLLSIWFNAIIE